MNDHNLNHHDPEHDALIQQLDALSVTDRSAPSEGFEQRVMDSISQQIAPAPIKLSAQSTAQQPTHMHLSWKFNIAAALLIVGSAALLIWTSSKSVNLIQPQNPQQTLVSLEEDLDALFDLTDFASDLDNDIDEIDLITDQMHTELSLPSVLMEISNNDLKGSL